MPKTTRAAYAGCRSTGAARTARCQATIAPSCGASAGLLRFSDFVFTALTSRDAGELTWCGPTKPCPAVTHSTCIVSSNGSTRRCPLIDAARALLFSRALCPVVFPCAIPATPCFHSALLSVSAVPLVHSSFIVAPCLRMCCPSLLIAPGEQGANGQRCPMCRRDWQFKSS